MDRGYAWAASSYATNGYDVGQGVRDTVALPDVVQQVTGRSAGSVLLTGASMGGHVVAVALERHPDAFAGAMPYCGVLGDTALFDYQLDANVTAAAPAGEDIEFAGQPTARATDDLTGIPAVRGTPRAPVLSLHDIGDLFVPLSMEQVYALRLALHGRSHLFVARAVRGVGHCDFTSAELRQGFDDLVDWVRTGRRPGGDAILDRRAVADPAFGCRWTVGIRATFRAPACPE